MLCSEKCCLVTSTNLTNWVPDGSQWHRDIKILGIYNLQSSRKKKKQNRKLKLQVTGLTLTQKLVKE